MSKTFFKFLSFYFQCVFAGSSGVFPMLETAFLLSFDYEEYV